MRKEKKCVRRQLPNGIIQESEKEYTENILSVESPGVVLIISYGSDKHACAKTG